jgi:hypothetical protein
MFVAVLLLSRFGFHFQSTESGCFADCNLIDPIGEISSTPSVNLKIFSA